MHACMHACIHTYIQLQTQAASWSSVVLCAIDETLSGVRSSSLLGVHCRFGRFFASVGRDGEPRRGALFLPISEALHGHHHRPEVVGGRCSCAQASLGGKGLCLADRKEGRCAGLVRYVPFCRCGQPAATQEPFRPVGSSSQARQDVAGRAGAASRGVDGWKESRDQYLWLREFGCLFGVCGRQPDVLEVGCGWDSDDCRFSEASKRRLASFSKWPAAFASENAGGRAQERARCSSEGGRVGFGPPRRGPFFNPIVGRRKLFGDGSIMFMHNQAARVLFSCWIWTKLPLLEANREGWHCRPGLGRAQGCRCRIFGWDTALFTLMCTICNGTSVQPFLPQVLRTNGRFLGKKAKVEKPRGNLSVWT